MVGDFHVELSASSARFRAACGFGLAASDAASDALACPAQPRSNSMVPSSSECSHVAPPPAAAADFCTREYHSGETSNAPGSLGPEHLHE